MIYTHNHFIVEVADSSTSEAERSLFEEILFETVSKYCADFNLKSLKKVILTNDLPRDSDGRNYKTHIAINAENIKTLVRTDGDEHKASIRKTLISTIYHELCHVETRAIMPNLYAICEDENSDAVDAFVAQFWIEYVTHVRYRFLENVKVTAKYCDDFLNYDWRKANHKYWSMIKGLPYFIYRWQKLHSDNFLIKLSAHNVANKFIKHHIEATYKICTKLVNCYYPFDDFDKLSFLRNLFYDNYYKFNKH